MGLAGICGVEFCFVAIDQAVDDRTTDYGCKLGEDWTYPSCSWVGPPADRHYHPVEPLAVRLTLLGRF